MGFSIRMNDMRGFFEHEALEVLDVHVVGSAVGLAFRMVRRDYQVGSVGRLELGGVVDLLSGGVDGILLLDELGAEVDDVVGLGLGAFCGILEEFE